MKRLYLLPNARPLTLITGFLMVILLGAFITITYQPVFAAEPPPNKMEQSGGTNLNDMDMKGMGKKNNDPCTSASDEPPVKCVGVPISPSPNEFGCTTGQQCSLSTQNKLCGLTGGTTTCKTEPITSGSTQCRCICK